MAISDFVAIGAATITGPSAQDQSIPMTFRVMEPPLSNQILQDGQPAGVVSLVGRSGPQRPLSFEGKQRVKTTWYPGNMSATQQVMGATLEPTTMTGRWSDKFLGNGIAAGLVVIFDTIRKMGSPVEVVWGAGVLAPTVIGTPYQRRGILTRFKYSPDRAQDITWEMDWEWASEGEVAAPVLSIGVVTPQSALADLQQTLDQVNFAVDSFRESPLGLLLELDGPITLSLDTLRDSSEELANIIDSAEKLAGSTGEISRHVLEHGNNISVKVGADAANLEDSFLEINLLTSETKDSPEDTFSLVESRLTVLQQASVARGVAAETSASLSGQLYPEVIAEVRVPAGTDLRVVAQEHYGDPDMWTLIAQYNNIDGSKVPGLPNGPSDNPFAVRPLRIPARDGGALSNLRTMC